MAVNYFLHSANDLLYTVLIFRIGYFVKFVDSDHANKFIAAKSFL